MSIALMLNHGIGDLPNLIEGIVYEIIPSSFKRNIMNKIYKFERWLDKYNHIMELIRTIIPLIVLGLQIFIILNLLN